ncbi:MAG: aminoacyl-tRNA hydrolase [Actinobacteria bacterium]|nr:aminoacyl-tRNA hydrolase [Actinomycetota bacterium]
MFRPSPHVERLVAGLGNPGPAYEGTRHNIGYRVVEELARRHGFPRAKRGFEGRVAEGSIRGRSVLLLQPTTFMNDSGRSVAAALRALKLTPGDLLVVHDHIDLPFGRLRLLLGGGSGGNNGVKSVTSLIGPDYARLRVGVDRPPSTHPDVVADYVLSRFSESRAEVDALTDAAADAVELWLDAGLEAAANTVNRLPR